jgi:hypothetical protein
VGWCGKREAALAELLYKFFLIALAQIRLKPKGNLIVWNLAKAFFQFIY